MFQIVCLLCLMPVIDCLSQVVVKKMKSETPARQRTCPGQLLSGVDIIQGYALMKLTSEPTTAAFETKREFSNCYEKVCTYNLTVCDREGKSNCYCKLERYPVKSLHYKIIADAQYQNALFRFSFQYGDKTIHSVEKTMPAIAKEAKEYLLVNNEEINLKSSSCEISLSYTAVTVLRYCVEGLDPSRSISVKVKNLDLKDAAKRNIPCVDIKLQLCQYDPEAVMMNVSEIIYLDYREHSGCKRKNHTECRITSYGKTKECPFLPVSLKRVDLISGSRTLDTGKNQASHVEYFQQLTIFLLLIAIFKTAFP